MARGPAIRGADALRPAELVGRQRHGIRAERVEIERVLSGGLHRVDMEPAAGFADQARDGFDRLNHAGLVVRGHEADERLFTGQISLKPVKVRDPASVDRPDDDLGASRFSGCADSVVLGGADNDPPDRARNRTGDCERRLPRSRRW